VKVLLSWVRDFVDVPASPAAIGARMSLRGLALEGLELVEPGPLPPGRLHEGQDAVLDFDVTANRPDCLSIIGIAREIATVYRLPLRDGLPATPEAADTNRLETAAEPIAVSIEDQGLCGRYVAAVAEVTVGTSPDWMRWRLTACGVRPINNVVDITNYVLLERGYPMHAFDLARLRGPAIVVRRARTGETLTTLDGRVRALEPGMLVIADAERPAALGGVMGGAESEVTSATQRIVLEAAWFHPPSVRGTSKRLGLRTEASYRFERGADLTATADAMARAVALLESTHAGRALGPVVDCYPAAYQEREVLVAARAIGRLLGMAVPDAETEWILRSLGFAVRPSGDAGPRVADTDAGTDGAAWVVRVPGWRVDIARPVDVIEEVGRHYGFEHLPSTFPAVEQAPLPSDPRIARDARARRALLGMGFSEAITFAFIEGAAAAPFVADGGAVTIANPLSEKFTTLRPSLVPGLVDAVSHNRRHGRRDVRLFEIGTRFATTGEVRTATVAWTGIATPDHWSGGRRDVDFFDLKGSVEQLCATFGVRPEFAAVTVPYLVEGRAAQVLAGDQPIGLVGQLHPAVAEARDLPPGDPLYILEIDLDGLSARAPRGSHFVTPLPRHPSVVRDLSILVDDTLSADAVRGTIRAANTAHRDPSDAAEVLHAPLADVHEFDRYQGKGIPEGKISLSLRLTFQGQDRTLTDAEVQAAMDGILAALADKLGAVQR
jgi:phenylalanyl-tRNA synthetase beta chain